MDRLTSIWEIQAKQQQQFNLDPSAMSALDRARASKDYILGLHEEVNELAEVTTHYKAHVLRSPRIERANVAEEAADILKFLVSICQLNGVTDQQLFDAFQTKTDVIADKARGQRLELERETKLIVSDLDNCIADLTGWQYELDRSRGNAPMNDKTLHMLESLKEDFYRGGGFLNIPPIDGAREGLEVIREAGFKIVLITARPHWQYKRLYGDTLQWLQKHNIPYDLILFNKDKAEAIYEHILPARPKFFVEDKAKHCIEVAAIGVPVLMMDWDYNKDMANTALIKRVAGWREIVAEVLRGAPANS